MTKPDKKAREIAKAWEIHNSQDDYDWTAEHDVAAECEEMWADYEAQMLRD